MLRPPKPKGKGSKYYWELHEEPGKVAKRGFSDFDDGPVPPLGPPPAAAGSVVPPDVEEAWKVYDTMLIASLGDRVQADQEFERVRVRRITKRGRHGKDNPEG